MNRVLVARVAEYVNPWHVLEIRKTRRNGPVVEGFVPEHERDSAYHHARIRHFVRELCKGAVLEPLEMDCLTDAWRIYPVPVLLDGHHRLAAAILAGERTIRVDFGGRVDVLRYLQGRRQTPPMD